MNSFDKGIESLYARHGEPITDATAIRSLRYFEESLPDLQSLDDPEVTEKAVLGGDSNSIWRYAPRSDEISCRPRNVSRAPPSIWDSTGRRTRHCCPARLGVDTVGINWHD